jgi:hypothetical protein
MKYVKTALFFFSIFLTASCTMFTDPEPSFEEGRITGIAFNRKSLFLIEGAADYLTLSVSPPALQSAAGIKWDYDPSMIAIQPDSYGVIVQAVQAGNTYIKAVSGAISATCIITIAGVEGEYTGSPYIYSNISVIQMTPGSVETVSASLYGGAPFDLEDFIWSASDPSVAGITYTRNNCIVTANRNGTSRITASHPKSPYPYNFIVYCRDDDFKEPYLTTNANIITINKSDNPSVQAAVSIVNSGKQVNQADFTWELVSSDGPPVLSVAGNGENALITALNEGLAQIRVSHKDCRWPVEILVRVTTTVQNVFITTSASTLIVSGSLTPYSVSANIEGYPGFVNPDAFTWEIPESARPLMLSLTHKFSIFLKTMIQ